MRKIVILQIAIAALLFIVGICFLLGGKPGKNTQYRLKDKTGEAAATSAPVTTVDTHTTEAVADATNSTEAGVTEPSETTEPTTVPFQMPEITWKTFPEDRQLAARHGFVYDCTNEEFLFLLNQPEDSVYMASITKLFAIHVASRFLNPEEEILIESGPLSKVSANSSTAGLVAGDILTAKQLYVGSLISGGNDAVYVLATVAGQRIAGDPELSTDAAIAAFVEEMNREAAEKGMTGTHFTNPDGYHDNDHYTCLRDLVTIAKLSLENTSVTEYGPQVEVEITPVRGGDKQWKNLNLLVDEDSQYYCPYAIGLKTGYTGSAGNCLLSAFEIGERQYIIGVFGCPSESDRFNDTLQLLNEMVILRDHP